MMKSEDLLALYDRYVMPTYTRSLVFTRGRGARLWDAEGREYLDALSGIAVTGVGHCHPKVARAIAAQARTLVHVSNLYYTEPQARLAEALATRSLNGKCFFCNSGAEANEALIKLARLYGHTRGRYEVVTMRNSFHGRTLATLTATGQTKVQKGFEPLPEGFVYADFNQLDSVRAALTDRTAAVLLEVVQGEGGILPGRPEFLKGVQALCRERDILLLCDEVQTGMGRTGRWFGYQHYGLEPDAFSLAKGLGNGYPIGAIVTGPKLADVFQPGHHASTFGGTPLACAAALATIEAIEEEGLVDHAARMGALFLEKLQRLARKHAFIREVRGLGLMIGMALDRPAKPLELLLRKHGLIALATAETVLRFLPPLNITSGQVQRAARIVAAACREWAESPPSA